LANNLRRRIIMNTQMENTMKPLDEYQMSRIQGGNRSLCAGLAGIAIGSALTGNGLGVVIFGGGWMALCWSGG
jgi:hypothetical protein